MFSKALPFYHNSCWVSLCRRSMFYIMRVVKSSGWSKIGCPQTKELWSIFAPTHTAKRNLSLKINSAKCALLIYASTNLQKNLKIEDVIFYLPTPYRSVVVLVQGAMISCSLLNSSHYYICCVSDSIPFLSLL